MHFNKGFAPIFVALGEFLYKGKYVWGVYLDPVLEGRAEPSQWQGISTDKEIYEKVLGSFRILP